MFTYSRAERVNLLKHLFQISATDLVCMEDLQKGFVDVGLALEAVLDLVDIVDGVVELHWLIVLNRRSGGGTAEWLVELHGRGPRRGVWRDGRIALATWCQCLRLERLWKNSKMIFKTSFSQMLKKTLNVHYFVQSNNRKSILITLAHILQCFY